MRSERLCTAVCAAAVALGVAGSCAAQQQPADPAARVAAIHARIAALDARATKIDDVDAIENLQSTYGYYTDKMLWDEVLDLFTDDATLEIGPSGVYVGKASIRRYLYSLSGGKPGPTPGVLFEHLQLEPVVTIAPDGRTAKARWHGLMMTGVSGTGSGGNWGDGVYENEYVKDGAVWKISKLHLFVRFIAPYEGGWLKVDPKAVDDYALGKGVEPDRPPSVRYDPYPGTYVPPFDYPNPVTGR
jgi:hypothetical protein